MSQSIVRMSQPVSWEEHFVASRPETEKPQE